MSLILSIIILRCQSEYIVKKLERTVPVFIFRPLIIQAAKNGDDVRFLMKLFNIDPNGGDFPRDGEVRA